MTKKSEKSLTFFDGQGCGQDDDRLFPVRRRRTRTGGQDDGSIGGCIGTVRAQIEGAVEPQRNALIISRLQRFDADKVPRFDALDLVDGHPGQVPLCYLSCSIHAMPIVSLIITFSPKFGLFFFFFFFGTKTAQFSTEKPRF